MSDMKKSQVDMNVAMISIGIIVLFLVIFMLAGGLFTWNRVCKNSNMISGMGSPLHGSNSPLNMMMDPRVSKQMWMDRGMEDQERARWKRLPRSKRVPDSYPMMWRYGMETNMFMPKASQQKHFMSKQMDSQTYDPKRVSKLKKSNKDRLGVAHSRHLHKVWN